MKCITHSEFCELEEGADFLNYTPRIEKWPHRIQGSIPEKFGPRQVCVRLIMEHIFAPCDFIVAVTDWALYTREQMIVAEGLRCLAGECRPLIEAPYHCYPKNELDQGIAMFAHSIDSGWSSTVISSRGKAVLGNWEGDIFDISTESFELSSRLIQLLEFFGSTIYMDRKSAD